MAIAYVAQSSDGIVQAAAPLKSELIAGLCLDENGEPLAGVTVTLYREYDKTRGCEKLGGCQTAADGRFKFGETLARADDIWLTLVVTKEGRQSRIQPLFPWILKTPLEFRLRPAAALSGRVADEAGKPIAAARVWVDSLRTGPLDGVASAITDADGKYTIPDAGRWTDEDAKPIPVGNGTVMVTSGCYFDVRHPDFAHERPKWSRVPSTVDVVLEKGGVIEGRVLDQVTGKPAEGASVGIQGIKDLPGSERVRTGADGSYQFRCLKPGRYNVGAHASDRTCVALEGILVTAGQTLVGQDLTLIEGGFITGRVIDAVTGAPVTDAAGLPISIGCYGQAYPRSGAACQSAELDKDGQFRLRVPPGRNHPYIMNGQAWLRTEGRATFDAGIVVKAGKETEILFRVRPIIDLTPQTQRGLSFPLFAIATLVCCTLGAISCYRRYTTHLTSKA